jgi:hypothetical protein
MFRSLVFVGCLLFALPVSADWLAVMGYDGSNRVTKYQSHDTEAMADTHVAAFIGQFPNAFVAENPGGGSGDWLVEPVGKTLSNSAPIPPALTEFVVDFDTFEARFEVAEWNAATDYVYESNTTTGKPMRRVLVQGLARAMARDKVDLLHAKTAGFLAALVSGGVVTQGRSDTILDPAQVSP